MLSFGVLSPLPKRSSNIMADDFFFLKKKELMSRIFICNFQFSQAEPPAEPRTDNRLQPVSAIALPVTKHQAAVASAERLREIQRKEKRQEEERVTAGARQR